MPLAVLALTLCGARAGLASSPYVQREDIAERCVREAERHIGMSFDVPGEAQGAAVAQRGAQRLVYLDVRAQEPRAPVRVRLYCTLDERGDIARFVSAPRLPRRHGA